MVLINGLTVNEINAALIALQRSKVDNSSETKTSTTVVQNISMSGSTGTDYAPMIQQIQSDMDTMDERVSSCENNIDNLSNRQTNLENDFAQLVQDLDNASIEGMRWDEAERMLSLMTETDTYSVFIPQETATLSIVNNNVLRFTLGEGENSVPQIINVTLPFVLSTEKGAANGVATLDGAGRVPYSQLPESAMEFKGLWDASSNTPHLADGTGVNGDFYICNTAGTVNFGTLAEPREITFYPNDRVIYEGDMDEWYRLPAGTVISVNGKSGEVVLDATDIDYATNTTIKQKIDAITPVNSVTSGETHPPTSGAVYTAIQQSGGGTDIRVYDNCAEAQADLPNLENGDWVSTPDGNGGVVDTVESGNMNAVTSNAVAEALGQWETLVSDNRSYIIRGIETNTGVYLQGHFQGFVSSTSLTALPAKYRPLLTTRFYYYISQTGTIYFANINSDGTITFPQGGTIYGDFLVRVEKAF